MIVRADRYDWRSLDTAPVGEDVTLLVREDRRGRRYRLPYPCRRTAAQGAAVGGREMHVEHLDSCELVEHGSRREARRQRLEPGAQGDVQAVGQEGDEDVRLDAVLELMVDRA